MRGWTERNLPLLCPPLYINHLTLRAEFLEGNRDLIAACRAKQAFRFLSIIVKLAVSEKTLKKVGKKKRRSSVRSSVFRLSWEAIFAREIARPLLSASPSPLFCPVLRSLPFPIPTILFSRGNFPPAAATALVNFHNQRDRSPVPHLLLRRTRRGEGCELQFTYEDLRPWWL